MHCLKQFLVFATVTVVFLQVFASEQDADNRLQGALSRQDAAAVSAELQAGAKPYFCCATLWQRLMGKQTCSNVLNFALRVYQQTGNPQLLNDVFKTMPTGEALALLDKVDTKDNQTPRQLFEQSQLAQTQQSSEEFFGQFIRRKLSTKQLNDLTDD
jgi:hypothetical protein